MPATTFSNRNHALWVECYKMQGSGNDFVLLDNRSLRLPKEQMPQWARKICRRAFGVGADGLIFLDSPQPGQQVDYIWHFYNADGSRAEMCGNGSRCAAQLAWQLDMAPEKHILGTDAGPITAHVFPDSDLVKVQLTPHCDLRTHLSLTIQERAWEAHFINTGVPHLVLIMPDIATVDVQTLGSQFRFHPHFSPHGTNVNFVQIVDKENILLRTYERGVEGETYACGTGAAAAALICSLTGHTSDTVRVTTSGREELRITLEDKQIFLTGKAVLVFVAKLFLPSLDLEHGFASTTHDQK
ncbi:MAG TPA: diaminopimelate epimerase [Desulfonatronum sp.]|nr:diaminopimelate epimerase [Desulfonatronum sp.]